MKKEGNARRQSSPVGTPCHTCHHLDGVAGYCFVTKEYLSTTGYPVVCNCYKPTHLKRAYDLEGRLMGYVVNCEESPCGECLSAITYDDGGHEDSLTPCDRDYLGRCPYYITSEE